MSLDKTQSETEDIDDDDENIATTSEILKKNRLIKKCDKNNKCEQEIINDQCRLSTLGLSDHRCSASRNFSDCHQPAVKTTYLSNNNLKCHYDMGLIDDIDMLREIDEKFGFRDEIASKVFPKLCSLTTTDNCDINNLTQKPFTKCMYLNSNNRYGEICKKWALLERNKEYVNQITENWCMRNPMSDFCLNRNTSPAVDESSSITVFESLDSTATSKPVDLEVYSVMLLVAVTIFLLIK